MREIQIADSSIISLRNSLATVLPGTGGDGPKAAIKVQGVFNATKQVFTYFSAAEGTRSDHDARSAHAALVHKGDLLIRDLGYFDTSDLRSLSKAEVFFLSRIPSRITKLQTDEDVEFDIWKMLAISKSHAHDFNLAIGDERFLTRVVALRLPRKKWRVRLAELRREKSRTLTRKEEARAKWNLLTTNLSTKQASAQTLQHLYALRWQVELIWKALKGSACLDRIKAASCKTVAMAYIWARLLYGVIAMACRRLVMPQNDEKEIGIIRWYRRLSVQMAKLRNLVIVKRWLALAKVMLSLSGRRSLREKQTKRSSLQQVSDHVKMDGTQRDASMR